MCETLPSFTPLGNTQNIHCNVAATVAKVELDFPSCKEITVLISGYASYTSCLDNSSCNLRRNKIARHGEPYFLNSHSMYLAFKQTSTCYVHTR